MNVSLRGAVQKGPFVVGSTIEVSELDNELNPTGNVFNTSTDNDLGEFSLSFEASGPVRLEGTGFYYNEITEGLSQGNLTLRAVYVPSGSGTQTAYVNLMTHLVIDRVENLVAAGADFGAAVAQAEAELRAGLLLSTPDFDPGKDAIEMNIAGGDDPANAYLLAVGSVLAKVAIDRDAKSPDAELQNLINGLSIDLGPDGELSQATIDELGAALLALDPDRVMLAFGKRLSATGSSAGVPNMHAVIDQDRDGLVNLDDNCPLDANPDQADTDQDGQGNACDSCPETACEGACIPAVAGAGDTCYTECGTDGSCEAGSACAAVTWVDGASVTMCATACDLLTASCASGQECTPGHASTPDAGGQTDMPTADGSWNFGGEWYCAPEPVGVVRAAAGESCEARLGACEAGLACMGTWLGSLCVSPCDPNGSNSCAQAACVPAYGEGRIQDRPPEEMTEECPECTLGYCDLPPGELLDSCRRYYDGSGGDSCAEGYVCAQSSNCDGGECCHEQCDQQAPSCSSGEVCVAANWEGEASACLPAAGPDQQCNYAGQCAEGYACSYEGCSNVSPCCRPACEDGTCADGLVCSSRASVDGEDPVCIEGAASCFNNVQDNGESDVDCGGDSMCGVCAEGQACNFHVPWPPAENFQEESDCEPGLFCIEGFCARPCDTSANDCGDGFVCLDPMQMESGDGVCYPEGASGDVCQFEEQCGEGLTCRNSEACGGNCCVTECDMNSPSCGEGEYCQGWGEVGGCVSVPSSCQNNKKDPNEMDVDCGDSCPTCGVGMACMDDGQGPWGCVEGAVCVNSTCREACDRSAPACPENYVCGPTQDWMNTTNGACQPIPASCSNQTKDPNESDVDCGGNSLCGPCGYNELCQSGYAAQCDEGLICYQGLCVNTFCDNQAKDGNESDVDCGGACDPCSVGLKCNSEQDCTSNQCISGAPSICAPNHCGSGDKDGDETDVDCGGSCRRCQLNGFCQQDDDCNTNWCDTDRCRTPSCSDQTRNGAETDVDCGGMFQGSGCSGCPAGGACDDEWDCAWTGPDACYDNVCRTCSDGVQNGTETGVDCGGTCDPC